MDVGTLNQVRRIMAMFSNWQMNRLAYWGSVRERRARLRLARPNQRVA